MLVLSEIIGFFILFGLSAYYRVKLLVWGVVLGLYLALLTIGSPFSSVTLSFFWIIFIVIFLILGFPWLRKTLFTGRVLILYRNLMPTMSRTEREALSAGTVGWEGEFFSGRPNWNKLLQLSKPTLSKEEQAFLNGPVNTLCQMADDWKITHELADLTPEMWDFIKREGFFALIIPKKYGGKQFSAYAHSEILSKLYSRCITLASTVAVPNSLGPAELLLHYGTEEQKNYYLPKLASGEEVPCFALTSEHAGSDAGSMIDHGIICWGEHEGKKILGIRLNWHKRYITLAPIATVIGLAFKLYDPDQLIGKKKELGITCALIPSKTKGITIGRRHYPANAVFQNGPIQGENVFIPLDWIIGGEKMAGQGWRMLMECLAAGRAISLPAGSTGGSKALVFATGAYAHIRRQFKTAILRFDGVEKVLARMVGNTYLMDAVRLFTLAAIDRGEQPAVASAIVKYHVTELGRRVANDGMDIHGGKGICLGPKNYIARFYESIPISITVEGANILTRNMIIFGQGVMRCHPYVFKEYEAAKMKDGKAALNAFDQALIKHLASFISHFVRSWVLGLTAARWVRAPALKTKRYFQQAARFSAAFAFLSDVALFTMGGSLKRKETISARLGDMLSYLYMITAVLKHYQDGGERKEDLPAVNWAVRSCFYLMQEQTEELFRNFPSRWLGNVLRIIVFPWGKRFPKPSDALAYEVTKLVSTPTDFRNRLSENLFLNSISDNMLAILKESLDKVIAAEPIEKLLKEAEKKELIEGDTLLDKAKMGFQKKVITEKQLQLIMEADQARQRVISVDDFSSNELARQ